MADYSRDSFKETNLLHQVLDGGIVDNPRHYVGVKLQQGVPLLDADWNEMDEIRRQELRVFTKTVIGDGIIGKLEGFRISAIGVENDFSINAGIAMIDGMMVILNEAITFRQLIETLPEVDRRNQNFDVPVTDTDFLIYIDAWDEDVGSRYGTLPDPRLENQMVGIETCSRVLRRWTIRIAEDGNLPRGEAGHHYLALARISRPANEAVIREGMIEDRRNIGLNFNDSLKRPLYLRQGNDLLNHQRFKKLMKNFRTILFNRFRDNELPYALPTDNPIRAEMVLLSGLEQLIKTALVAEKQANNKLLDNKDALTTLADLYEEQVSWLDLLETTTRNNANDARDVFIEDYRSFLGAVESGIDPSAQLRPNIESNNLLGAVAVQEDIVNWLTRNSSSDAVDTVSVLSQAGSLPDDDEHIYRFTLAVTFESGNESATETFQPEVTLPDAFGTYQVLNADLTPLQADDLRFSPTQRNRSFAIRVTPRGSLTETTMLVRARAASPGNYSNQLPVTISNAPVIPSIQYAGREDITRTVEINRFDTANLRVSYQLINATNTARDYMAFASMETSSATADFWNIDNLTPILDNEVSLDRGETSTTRTYTLVLNLERAIPQIGDVFNVTFTARTDGEPDSSFTIRYEVTN